jgi:hypothetical protein
MSNCSKLVIENTRRVDPLVFKYVSMTLMADYFDAHDIHRMRIPRQSLPHRLCTRHRVNDELSLCIVDAPDGMFTCAFLCPS